MREIIQPTDLEKPEIQGPLADATMFGTYYAWIRKIAPQFELNAEEIIKGEVLKNIIGDDIHAFGLTGGFKSENADIKKANLNERMDWETKTQETPQIIKNQINKFRNDINSLDWSKEKEFKQACEIWLIKICNFTKHQIALNKDFRNAIDYSNKANDILIPYWRVFLFDE